MSHGGNIYITDIGKTLQTRTFLPWEPVVKSLPAYDWLWKSDFLYFQINICRVSTWENHSACMLIFRYCFMTD